MKKNLYRILLGVFIILFIVSSIFVVRYFLTSSKTKSAYTELSDFVAKGTTSSEVSGETEENPKDNRLEAYAELKERNEDFFGWIKIADTNIDYPVMYTEEPEFYLRKNFEKEYSDAGSVFLDYRYDENERNNNLLVYGHNMNDGSMFADILKYKKQDYYNEHSVIEFDEIDKLGKFQIFAIFEEGTSGGFAYFNDIYYSSNYQFKEFIKTLKKKSLYDTGVTPKYGERLLMLSTCETTAGEGRFVVVAKEIK